MEHVQLGRSDLKVSVIGLGAWQWGTKAWGWGKGYGRQEALAAFEKAMDVGINFIDTAEIYGGGLSEELVGETIKGRRNDVIVATKVSPWHLRHGSVLKAAEGSLRRLGIKEIDLYQIHFPNPVIPIKSTMEAMGRLVKEGKVRCIGVSNFSLSRLKKAQGALTSSEIVSNQVRYNLLQRSIEKDLLPYATRERISIIAYSPLAQGVLTGKYGPHNPPRDGIRSSNILFSPENLRRALPLIEVLKEIGDRRGKTIAQVALNWLLREPTVVAIPGAKGPAQVEANAGASGWRLAADEIKRIDVTCQRFRVERLKSIPRTAIRVLFGL